MDIHSVAGDELFRYLLGISIFAIVTERTIHLAMAKASGDFHPNDRISRTIGSAPALLGITSLFSWAPILYVTLARGFSMSDIFDVLSQTRESLTVFGWAMTILVLIQSIAPILVASLLIVANHRHKVRAIMR